jgi:hypothetical protein
VCILVIPCLLLPIVSPNLAVFSLEDLFSIYTDKRWYQFPSLAWPVFGEPPPSRCGPRVDRRGSLDITDEAQHTTKQSQRAILHLSTLVTFFSPHPTLHEASNKSTSQRSSDSTTPPPCLAERYSRRTRTSPRRSMSPFRRLRSWAQYV